MVTHTDSGLSPVVLFGTYDLGKPRNRIMLASLQSQGVEVEQVHVDVWKHVEDKTQTGFLTRLRLAVRWALAYPLLIWNYLRAPAHKVVMVAYPGILDILVVSLLARARGAKIVLDAFISIYDTVVIDRQLIRSSSFAAKLLYQPAIERTSSFWIRKHMRGIFRNCLTCRISVRQPSWWAARQLTFHG